MSHWEGVTVSAYLYRLGQCICIGCLNISISLYKVIKFNYLVSKDGCLRTLLRTCGLPDFRNLNLGPQVRTNMSEKFYAQFASWLYKLRIAHFYIFLLLFCANFVCIFSIFFIFIVLENFCMFFLYFSLIFWAFFHFLFSFNTTRCNTHNNKYEFTHGWIC